MSSPDNRIFLGVEAVISHTVRLLSGLKDNCLILTPDSGTAEKLQSSFPNLLVRRELEGIAALASDSSKFPTQLEREFLMLHSLKKLKEPSRKLIFGEKAAVANLSQARAVIRLFDELTLNGLSLAESLATIAKDHRVESARWENLNLLEALYKSSLSAYGLLELNDNLSWTRKITRVYLLVLTDLSQLSEKIISKWSEQTNGKVIPIICDEKANERLYSPYGKLVGSPSVKASRPELPQATYVEYPRDYSDKIKELSAEANAGICVLDAEERKLIANRLRRNSGESAPTISIDIRFGKFLRALLDYLQSNRLYDLYTVFRFSRLEKLAHCSESGRKLLVEMDKYHDSKLQLRAGTALPNEVVDSAYKLITESFISELKGGVTVSDFGSRLEKMFALFSDEAPPEAILRFKESRITDLVSPEDLLSVAIRQLTLQETIDVGESFKIVSTVSQLLFLEESRVILIGLNEQSFPYEARGSGFLSEGIKRLLKLPSRERAKEVDEHSLKILGKGKQVLGVVVARRNLRGDRTFPSAALFPEDPSAIAKEIERFYLSGTEKTLKSAAKGKPILTLPVLDEALPTSLSVSQVELYFTRPYQFYLEHILKLTSLSDSSRELNSSQFGSLTHATLNLLATDEKLVKPEQISDALSLKLDEVVGRYYGDNISSAVRAQIFHLRERLAAFSRVESEMRLAGWKTFAAEKTLVPYKVSVPEGEIKITGRLDRIDIRGGKYRIWDYKTWELGGKIAGRDGTIYSLQLPLYALLLIESGAIPPDCELECGYIQLKQGSVEIYQETLTKQLLAACKSVLSDTVSRYLRREFSPAEQERAFSDFAPLYPPLDSGFQKQQ